MSSAEEKGQEVSSFPEIARERSKQIGEILSKTRKEAKRSLAECAQVINTSRQRYRKLEEGEADITVVELEAVCSFLNVPLGYMLAGLRRDNANSISPILLQTEEGQTVRLTLELVK